MAKGRRALAPLQAAELPRTIGQSCCQQAGQTKSEKTASTFGYGHKGQIERKQCLQQDSQ
jgi:hypothetical protein